MAHNSFQLNYDELASIAKQFKDEGEDIARLHANTRQRVRDLYKEWVGEGAEKFFDEMETQLLPAVQRLSQALFHSQDISDEIMKIIQNADEETAGFFRNQLSGDDFGASQFGAALQGLQGASSGADDFGAGKFGDALGNPPSGGGSSSPDDFGAGKFGEALGGDTPTSSDEPGQPGETTSSQGGGEESSEKKEKQPEETEMETQPTSGGGGGSSSSSQGLEGDLKKMGVGLSEQVSQNAASGSGSGGPVNMPDHVYSTDSSAESGGSEPKPGADTGPGDSGQPTSEGGSGVAAGIAGVAGATAAGGAAKVIKEKDKENGE